jgi:hypothetical protein
MSKKSILERGNDFRDDIDQGLTFCRITKVFPDKRMCEVKTFGGRGFKTDNHVTNCQWISADANPDGDESSAIPRVNSYGILAFVDGEPFIIGYFKPLNSEGNANFGKDLEELNEGDRVLKTVGLNKIILRASGEIQIESNRTCRSIWFPERSLINTLCRNYEFRTDGGTIDWEHLDENDQLTDTIYREEKRDNIERTNIIQTQEGTITRGDPLIYRRQFGKGVDGDSINAVVHTTEILNTGETKVFIRSADAPNGYNMRVQPSGETDLNIGDRSKLNIKPTGETTYNVAGKANVNIKPDGTTTIDVGPGKSTLTIKPSGETELKTTAKIVMTSPKIDLNKPMSGIITANGTNGVVDFITGVPVTPSTTVFSDV